MDEAKIKFEFHFYGCESIVNEIGPKPCHQANICVSRTLAESLTHTRTLTHIHTHTCTYIYIWHNQFVPGYNQCIPNALVVLARPNIINSCMNLETYTHRLACTYMYIYIHIFTSTSIFSCITNYFFVYKMEHLFSVAFIFGSIGSPIKNGLMRKCNLKRTRIFANSYRSY